MKDRMRQRAAISSSSVVGAGRAARHTNTSSNSTVRASRRAAREASNVAADTRESILVFATTICAGWWFILIYRFYVQMPMIYAIIPMNRHFPMGTSVADDGAPNQRTSVFQGATIRDPTATLKLPTPIIVVGLPKSGTTSISAYFRCGRIASSHFSCEVAVANGDTSKENEVPIASPSSPGADSWRNCRLPPTHGTDAGSFPLCAVCVERNILRGRPPLEGCGPYDVFAELDSADHPLPSSSSKRNLRSWSSLSLLLSASTSGIQPLCSYPQMTHLDAIHNAYPNATFILNTRPVGHWIRSISNWAVDDKQKRGVGYLRQVLTQCDLPGFPSGIGNRDEELASFYRTHSRRIQNFVRKHPSHVLVEIDIEADETALTMEKAFGISSECWNQHNPTIREKRGGSDVNNALQISGDDSQDEDLDLDVKREKPDTSLVLDYLECDNIKDVFPKVKIK